MPLVTNVNHEKKQSQQFLEVSAMNENEQAVCCITKDKPNVVERLIDSIQTNAELSQKPLLVVDDSSTVSSREQVESIVGKHQGPAYLFNGPRWETIKSGLKFSPSLQETVSRLKLGRATWNTPDVRNISQMVLRMIQPGQVLFLDDDRLLDERFRITREPRSLTGYRIAASPDLSRLEWISWFSRIAATSFEQTLAKTPQPFVDKLYKELGPKASQTIIANYTDLIENRKQNSQELAFPFRKELSGGAFSTDSSIVGACLFPNWYEEDWTWFNQTRKRTGGRVRFSDSTVLHSAQRKPILEENALLFEEKGKILDTALRERDEPTVETIEACKERRLYAIKFELARLQTPQNATQAKIKLALQNLEHRIVELSSTELADQIKSYLKADEAWSKAITTVPKLELSDDRIIVIAPHCDDVAYSLGGAAQANLLKIGKVITAFSKSSYTITGHGPIETVSASRAKEEAAYCETIGATLELLNYTDACDRLETQDPAKYLSADNAIDHRLLSEITQRILSAVPNQNTLVMFPLGLGNHLDHRIIAEAGFELGKKGLSVAFYEDAPYDDSIKEDEIRKRTDRASSKLLPVELHHGRFEEKCKVLDQHYPTQFDNSERAELEKCTRQRNIERIWVPEVNLPKVLQMVIQYA